MWNTNDEMQRETEGEKERMEKKGWKVGAGQDQHAVMAVHHSN